MLLSVLEGHANVQIVFAEHHPKELHRVTAIDTELLKSVVDFLQLFHEATKTLEGSDGPTLHQVIPWFAKLKNHCTAKDTDSEDITALKSLALKYIREKFNPGIQHKVAVFLNPKQKPMKALTPADQQLVMEYVSDQLDSMPLSVHQTSNNSATPPPTKRRCIDEFDDDEEEDEDTAQTCEVQRYKDLKVQGPTPVLPFWRSKESDFPGLATLARNTFCIQASSSASERVFSLAGHVVNTRRSRLKPCNVDNILFLNSALRK